MKSKLSVDSRMRHFLTVMAVLAIVLLGSAFVNNSPTPATDVQQTSEVMVSNSQPVTSASDVASVRPVKPIPKGFDGNIPVSITVRKVT